MPICKNLPSISPETAICFSLNLIGKHVLSRFGPVSKKELRKKPLNFFAVFFTRQTLPGFWGFKSGFVTVADVGKLRASRNLYQNQLIMIGRRVEL